VVKKVLSGKILRPLVLKRFLINYQKYIFYLEMEN